jgi:hypothetical protein
MQEIGELDRIVNKEHRGVVANHIVISFLSVEFNGKTTRVSNSIGCTSLTSDGRESQK